VEEGLREAVAAGAGAAAGRILLEA
jgi:hypothetical protein